MNFLKKLFKPKQPSGISYDTFWTWFNNHEKEFHAVVKNRGNIEKDLFDRIAPKLKEVHDGFFLLTGMYTDDVAELVISVSANLSNIVFAEELVAAAPKTDRWRFTALIPALDIENVSINTSGYEFHKNNLSFYSNEDPEFPDEIDITIVHNDCTPENKSKINFGIFTFLDNYIGELAVATIIDNIEVITLAEAEKELIPIQKLKEFIHWRQKEFVEKYDSVRADEADTDRYSVIEGTRPDGTGVIALINTTILRWHHKASYPWAVHIELPYDGSRRNGMPETNTSALLEQIEETINSELTLQDGVLNIGRQTGNNRRSIYLFCKDFRKPSKVIDQVQKDFASKTEINFDIFNDKYWNSVDHYNANRKG